MTDTPSRRSGLRDDLINALGQIPVIPPVAHRRQQADNVLTLLYREWPWLRAQAEDLAEGVDETPVYGCTIDGKPAIPILASEYNQLVTDLAEAQAEVERLRADIASCRAQQWPQRLGRAERERDTARQHSAAIAAQRDRLRQRMNTLADRWDNALAPDKAYARALRAEISVAPFHDTSTAVQAYRADDGNQKWAARCWGTDTCDGWLSLDHDTERWAETARDRHIAEDHTEPAPAATQAAEHVYLSTGCLHGDHDYCKSMTGLNGAKRPGECKKCAAKCICGCHGGPNPT